MINKLGICMTQRCNAACDICCFSCSPASQQHLDADLIFTVLNQAASTDHVKEIHFTGGEPFLDFDLLCDCVSQATALGLSCFIHTNGFWGADEKDATNKIDRLKAAGVKHICFSADEFHQKFIPQEHLRTALRTVRYSEIASSVITLSYKISEVANLTQWDDQVKSILGEEAAFTTIAPSIPIRIGRAETVFPATKDPENCRCSFDSMAQLGFDGNYYVCCSPVSHVIPHLRLGSAYEMTVGDIAPAILANDYLFVLIKIGFRWYVKTARRLGFDIPERIGSPCDHCRLLFENSTLIEALALPVETVAYHHRLAHQAGSASKVK